MGIGWISINRKIQCHWLWQEKREFSKLEAWFDILLTVNHAEKKLMIKNTLFVVKRGQSINSLETWGKRWKWSRGRVKRFFDLLRLDEMIEYETNNKTTMLTVCKYDSYQDGRTSNEHQTNIKRTSNEHQTNTNNNVNNINNDNNENNKKENNNFNFRKSLLQLGADEQLVIDWLKVRKLKKASNTQTAFNSFKKQYEKSGALINVILEKCVVKSWAGFNSEWLVENKNKPDAMKNVTF